MANNIRIDITASDKATQVVRKVNAAIQGAVKPITDVGKVAKSLAKETGLVQVGDHLRSIGETAIRTGEKLGALSGPMALIGGAGSIAGMAALAAQWGRAGVSIANTAGTIGVSRTQLQLLTGAAELAGLSGESAAQGIGSLASTLHEATYGRNPQAVAMLNQLGVTLHRTKTGGIDAARALEDIADAIKRQPDPQTQGFIARMFGIEALLPILRQGGEGVRALEEQVRRSGAAMDEAGSEKAKEFGQSLNKLGTAVKGVGTAIEQNMIPFLKPVIDGLTQWIEKNRETAATLTELGSGAGVAAGLGVLARLGLASPATAVAAGVATAAAGTAAAVSATNADLDQYGVMMDPEGGMMMIPPPPGVPKGIPIGLRQNNPFNLRRWGNAAVKGGYAAFPTRAEGLSAGIGNLIAYGRHGYNTIDKIVEHYAPASDHNDVAAYEADLARRTGFAHDQALDLSDPAVLQKLAPAIIGHEQGRQPFSSAEIADAIAARLGSGGAQTVKVEIDVKGAAPGTTAVARGGDGTYLPTRVDYSMPGATMP